MPAKTIADNAGVEGAVIVGKLLESDETSDYGYNAAKGALCGSQCSMCNRGHESGASAAVWHLLMMANFGGESHAVYRSSTELQAWQNGVTACLIASLLKFE